MTVLLTLHKQVYKHIVDETHETAEKESNSKNGERERRYCFKCLKSPCDS